MKFILIEKIIREISVFNVRHFFRNRQNDAYKADRIVQSLEAGEWIQLTSRDAEGIIYCGDLNTEPGDLPHQVLTKMYRLQDAQSGLECKFHTCFDADNCYRNSDLAIPNPRPITIDYIFYKSFLPHKVNTGSKIKNSRS